MVVIKIKDILGKKFINVHILSRMTGINTVNLYRLCNNKCSRVSLDALEKICKALNCRIEDIIKFE